MPGFYEKVIVPPLIDCLCGLDAITKQRQKILPQARGKVLEVGLGRGRNLPHYDKAQVTEIVGLDPVLEFDSAAQRRIDASGLNVNLLSLSAEDIPAADGSFDTVVCTYTLCSIDRPEHALREMRRVLKPSGQLLFCEHGEADQISIATWQHRLTPAWRKIAGNCHMNRNVSALLQNAGFSNLNIQQGYIPGPRILCYNYWGSAQR